MPVYNDIRFVVDSTLKTKDNFKYTCAVKLDNFTNPVAFTIKLHPNHDNGQCIFKINRELEDYITSNFLWFESSLQYDCTDSYRKVFVYFGIEYTEYDPNGVVTYVSTAEVDLVEPEAPFIAWNGVFDYVSQNNFDLYETYFAAPGGGGSLAQFLTNRNTRITIDIGSTYWLYALVGGTTPSMKIEVTDTSNVTRTFFKVFTSTAFMQAFACGPNNLNQTPSSYWDVYPGGLSAGYNMIINSDTVSYTVQLIDGASVGNSPASEKVTFIINHDAYKQSKPVRLAWLNKLGGYDQMTFSLKHESEVNITNRSEYSKIIEFEYRGYNRGTVNLDTKAIESIVLVSDYLTSEEVQALEEIYTSPDVYVMDINTPICITQNVNGVLYPLPTYYNTFKYGGFPYEFFSNFYYDVPGNGIVPQNACTVHWEGGNGGRDPLITDVTGNDIGLVYSFNVTTLLPPRPVIVTDTKFLIKDFDRKRNHQVVVNLKYAYNIFTQRGN